VRTRGAAEVVKRTSVLEAAVRHAVAFVVLSAVFYGFFALMGHSLASAAHKARSNSELRAANARQDVLEIGRQVSSLVSSDSLERWARGRGFERPGTLLAMHDASTTD
jgi:hypothetical protein